MSFDIIHADPAKNLVESVALLEAGVASVLVSESDLLDLLLVRDESADNFLTVNNQVISIICCLRGLQEAIITILHNSI